MAEPPRLLAVATAVPPHVLHQREVAARAERNFPSRSGDFWRIAQVYENAGIDTRYSCVPIDWYEEEHDWASRNAIYLESAVELLTRATQDCLRTAGRDLDDIGGVVAVSSTGIATPSLDALVMERLGLPRDVVRLPIFGLGCAGGVLGLSRAAVLARARPQRPVLLLVVELCALTFRLSDASNSNIVATALFGDGAAAALIAVDGRGPALAASGEHTWPDSLDVMGWRVEEDGFGVLFSRHIPALVRRHYGAAALEFLAEHGLTVGDIDQFVCHPGGVKVVDAIEDAFGLARGGLVHAREVLRQYGNMSAATVLFVLERTLKEAPRGRFLLSALGPGFTAGFQIAEA